MNAATLRGPVFLAMEALWLYAGIALLVSGLPRPDAPPLAAVAGALLAGYAAVRLSRNLDVDEGTARAAGLGVGLVALALVLRLAYAGDPAIWRPGILGGLLRDTGATYDAHSGGVIGGLALAVVWARGAWTGGRPAASDREVRSFAVGLAVVAIGLALGNAAGTNAARQVALPFGALGFAALATSQAERTRFAGSVALPRWWLGVLAGGLAAALVLAAVLSLLPWGAPRGPLAAAGDGLAWAVTWVLIIVLTPVFAVAGWVVNGLLDLVGRHGLPELQNQNLDLSGLRDAARDEPSSPFPSWAGPAFRYGVTAIVAGIALWVASSFFRRRAGADSDRPERASLLDRPEAKVRQRWFDRFWPRAHDWPGGGAIGRLYGELLEESARRGLPRPPHRTPHEFAPDVSMHLSAPVAAEISDAFARARYGGLLPDDGEVERLRRSLRGALSAARQGPEATERSARFASTPSR